MHLQEEAPGKKWQSGNTHTTNQKTNIFRSVRKSTVVFYQGPPSPLSWVCESNKHRFQDIMVSNNMTAKMMRRTREQDVEKVRKSDGRDER